MIDGGPLVVEQVPLARVVKTESTPDGPPHWMPEPVEVAGDTYAICRCGRSSAKPFCDRWPDRLPCFDEPPLTRSGPVPDFTWRPPDGADGPLLAVKANGPVRVSGGAPIEREDGSPVDPGERVSLCRCGNSAVMPFCDSSHTIVGFRDD